MMKRRGAIAIGSNSTRLLVADVENGALFNIHRGREETRLFLGLDEQGMIAPEKIESTARAVARLAREARAQGAEDTALFATSATRDAGNGKDLADRIFALCGLTLQIITGEREAELAFLAAAGMERKLIMDIGGGSTEFTIGEGGKILSSFSAQLGASRLLKACPIASVQDALVAREQARAILEKELEKMRPFFPAPDMTGLGGTCTTAAAIRMGYEAHGEMVEGQVISLQEAERQLLLMASLPLEAREKIPGLPPSRAAHMPHGLCILTAAMQLCGKNEITVSGRTNLDGYLMQSE
ncbi:MAG: hypothetical protein IJD39_06395 [Clostridia bacterium]|nr:hypothetical protein [Clostridia bacterium]